MHENLERQEILARHTKWYHEPGKKERMPLQAENLQL